MQVHVLRRHSIVKCFTLTERGDTIEEAEQQAPYHDRRRRVHELDAIATHAQEGGNKERSPQAKSTSDFTADCRANRQAQRPQHRRDRHVVQEAVLLAACSIPTQLLVEYICDLSVLCNNPATLQRARRHEQQGEHDEVALIYLIYFLFVFGIRNVKFR